MLPPEELLERRFDRFFGAARLIPDLERRRTGAAGGVTTTTPFPARFAVAVLLAIAQNGALILANRKP